VPSGVWPNHQVRLVGTFPNTRAREPSLLGETAAVSRWENPAAWYDLLNPWGPSDDFYLGLVMSTDRVLDVGCGTGRLLHRARDAGHTGCLCGLDPDPAMLDQARVRTDIEWVLADAASAAWDRDFDLAVMAGHAFQVFVEDDQLRKSLSRIRAALVDGGLFAFETRDPRAHAWEDWNTSFEIRNPAGEVARVEYEVQDVKGDVVRLTETLSGQRWDRPQTVHGSLRFLDLETLTRFLREAGFVVDEQFGDWHRGPLTETSEEIITIARRDD
jgi:SAM-dependent methyltransferase